METFFVILAVSAAVWFALLMRRPQPAKKADDDGFAVDPALTMAIDDSVAEHVRFKGYP